MFQTVINGVPTVLDIVQIDSGEEPENACVNTAVVARVGDVTFQYAMPPERAIEALKSDLAWRADANAHGSAALRIPNVIHVRVIHFHERFTIDWDVSRSMFDRSVEHALSEDARRAALGRDALKHMGMASP